MCKWHQECGNKNGQLVLQNCSKTSLKFYYPRSNLSCNKSGSDCQMYLASLAIVTETLRLSWLISVMRLFRLKICEEKGEKYRLYFVFPLPRPITPAHRNLTSFATEKKEIATGLENEPIWRISNFCRSGGIVPWMLSLMETADLTPCLHLSFFNGYNEGQEIARKL